MPLTYHITPLDAHGETIPARMPYTFTEDPFERNNCILQVEDAVFSAKRQKRLLEEIETHFVGRKIKPPIILPFSCVSVRVWSPDGYRAVYNIRPLPYRAVTLRIESEESEFAEWLGQPFSAQWCPWPFGSEEVRRVWTAIRFLEELPFTNDTLHSDEYKRYQRMSAELARSMFCVKKEKGAYLTETSLRYARAEVVGSRLRPMQMARTAAKIGQPG